MTRRPGAGATEPSPSIFFELYALGHAVRRLLADAMIDSPISPDDYAIYSAIFEDEQLSPSRLARRLRMPLTTAMDHVGRLERRGHARRMPDPRDRRATLVTLTAKGLAVHRAANRYFELAYARFVDALAISEKSATDALRAIGSAVEDARSGLVSGSRSL